MKKMENFLRRVLSMVLCLCMLTGNMGGALALTLKSASLLDAVSQNSKVYASLEFLGINKAGYNLPGNYDSNKDDTPKAYFRLNVSVEGFVSNLIVGLDIQGLHNDDKNGVAIAQDTNGTNASISETDGRKAVQMSNLIDGNYEVIVQVPLHDDTVRKLINGTGITYRVEPLQVNNDKVWGNKEYKKIVANTSATLTPSLCAQHGGKHIKWTLHYTNDIMRLGNTSISAVIDHGSILDYKEHTPTNTATDLRAYVNTPLSGDRNVINAQQTVDKPGRKSIVFDGLYDDKSKGEVYSTDVTIEFYSELPDGQKPVLDVSVYPELDISSNNTPITMTASTFMTYDVELEAVRDSYGAETAVDISGFNLYGMLIENNYQWGTSALLANVDGATNKKSGSVAYEVAQQVANPSLVVSTDGSTSQSNMYADGSQIKLDLNNDGTITNDEIFDVSIPDNNTVKLVNHYSSIEKTGEMVNVNGTPCIKWQVVLGGTARVVNGVLTDTISNGSELVVDQHHIFTIKGLQDQVKTCNDYGNLHNQLPVTTDSKSEFVLKLTQDENYYNKQTTEEGRQIVVTYYTTLPKDADDNYVDPATVVNTVTAGGMELVSASPESNAKNYAVVASFRTVEGATTSDYSLSSAPTVYVATVDAETKQVTGIVSKLKLQDGVLVGNAFVEEDKENQITLLVAASNSDPDKLKADYAQGNKYRIISEGKLLNADSKYFKLVESAVIENQASDAVGTATFTLENSKAADLEGLALSTSQNIYVNPNENEFVSSNPIFPGGYDYDSGVAMGIAGNFHIVAFDTAEIVAHTNGNILANTVKGNGQSIEFGTHGLSDNEVSYVQHFTNVGSLKVGAQEYKDNQLLVVGKDVKLGVSGNGLITVDGASVEYPSNVMVDADGPFIDLVDLETRVSNYSSGLLQEDCGVSVTTNEIRLLDPDATGYLNITAKELANLGGGSKVSLTGFKSGHNGALVINVDCSSVSEIHTPTGGFDLVVNGSSVTSGEYIEHKFGRVIFNFIGAQGKKIVHETGVVFGMLIAPDATVEAKSTVNGSIIADNVIIRAESHRVTFTGGLSPAQAYFSAWKKLDDVDATGSDFTFYLQEVAYENNQVTTKAPVAVGDVDTDEEKTAFGIVDIQNNADNYIKFDNIPPFNQSGTYYYRIGELKGTSEQYTYDSTCYYVKVTVTASTNNGDTVLNTGYEYFSDSNLSQPINDISTIVFNNYTKQENITLSGQKTWVDYDYKDEYRPASITVKVMAGEEEIRTQTVTADNDWKYTFTDLPGDVSYKIVEEPVPGYTLTYGDSSYDLVNTLETVNVSGMKRWFDDYSVTSTARPTSITLKLLRDGVVYQEQTVQSNGSNGWSYSFNNLPKYQPHTTTPYNYTVQEVSVPGYSTTYEGTSINNTLITTEVEGTKTWVDNNAAMRPASINVTLQKTVNNTTTNVETKTITPDDQGVWSWKWEKLPTYEYVNNTPYEVTYSVVEERVPYYKTTYSGYNITNTLKLTSLEGEKLWMGEHPDLSIRPESITVNLLRNDKVIANRTVSPSATGEWKWVFAEQLAEDANGVPYTYEFEEIVVPGYTQSVSTDGKTITNTLITTNVSVVKVWDHGDKTPVQIQVQLKADDQAIGEAVTLPKENVADGENAWEHAWNGLPKYDQAGDEIKYTVDEVTVPEGYEKSIAVDKTNGFAYTITNTFVNDVTAEFEATKTLEGRDLEANQFSFELTAETVGAPMPVDEDKDGKIIVKNDGEGAVKFPVITFTKGDLAKVVETQGTFTYIIKEIAGDSGKGYAYDTNEYEAYVTLTQDSETKQLTAAVSYEGDKAPEFKNTYNTNPASISIPVEKVLTSAVCQNAPDITKAYTFAISGKVTSGTASEAPMPEDENGNKVTELKNPTATGGTVTFRNITFTEVGEYEYTITETGTVDGVKNDADAATGKKVTVTVTDDGEGNLVAKSSLEENEKITFTNHYELDKAEVEIPVEKVLELNGFNGPDSIKEAFTFKLEAVDGAPMPTENTEIKGPGENGAAVKFGKIEYTTAGTFQYKVTETGTVAGVTNDSGEKIVTVKVTEDRANGKLVATVEGNAVAGVKFENSYKAEPVTAKIPVKKELKNELNREELPDIANEFTFKISGVIVDENAAAGTTPEAAPNPTNGTSFTYDGKTTITFEGIKFEKPGVYQYTIVEEGEVNGVTNDSAKTVTFTVVDDKQGNLTYTTKIDEQAAANDTEVVFTNTYRAGSVDLEIPVEKKLVVPEGLNGPQESKTGAFTFTLSGSPMPEAGGEVVTVDLVNGKVAESAVQKFGKITFVEPGTYTYTITESGSVDGVINSAAKTVTVVVTDDASGQLKAEMQMDGETVTEVEIENNYNATPDSITIDVDKSYVSEPAGIDKPSIDNKYKFVITGEADAPMPDTKELTLETLTNDKATLTFGEIKFTKADTYTYSISEVPVTEGDTVPGVSIDSVAKTVTVTVTDDGKGTLTAVCDETKSDKVTLSFTNTYKVGEVDATIYAKKELTVPDGATGPDIAKKFQFTLTADTPDAPMPEGSTKDQSGLTKTVDCGASGIAVDFGKIVFTKPGTYIYRITESGTLTSVENDADAETGKTVTINVTALLDGKMKVETTNSSDNPVVFTNTYKVEPATAVVNFEKVLEKQYDNLKPNSIANAYNFVLKAVECAHEDGYKMPATTTKTLDGTGVGTGSFDAITFTKEGDYKFTVTEVNEVAGITNDIDTVRDVTITVEDNGVGQLVATIVYDNNATNAKFTNTYKVTPTTAEVKVKKTVETGVFDGLDVNTIEKAFNFTLAADVHSYMPEGSADGKKVIYTTASKVSELTFGEITFDKPGTYKYTVTEAGHMDGIENDQNLVRPVTIEVVDNGNGTLTAKVMQSEVENNVVAYTNTYTAKPTTFTIPVVKTLTSPEGVTAPDITGKYNFTISIDGDKPLPMENGVAKTVLVYNGEAKLEYPAITFTEPGTYVYTITEGVVGTAVPGVTTDAPKTVTVKVVDNGKGQLVIDEDATTLKTDKSVEFENKYNVGSTDIILSVNKTLSIPDGLVGPDSINNLFTFTLTPKDNAPMPDDKDLQKENDGTGSVSFGKITFTKPGTYTYSITESGTYDYITNDPISEKTVVVTVVTNENAELTASSNVTDNTVTFENTYKVTEEQVTVFVEKLFELKGLTGPSDEAIDGKFKFVLTGSNVEDVTGTVPMPTTTEVTYSTDTDAEMSFGPIVYTTAGTWNYTITEQLTGEAVPGVTNDTTPKTFTVTVTDNKDGTLTVEKTGLTDNKVTFTNTYDADDATFEIPVDKTVAYDKTLLSGPTEVADAFTFELSRYGENSTDPLPENCKVTVSSKGGQVSFGEITFSEPGTYKYWVTETGNVDGVTNDVANKKLVTIDVEDQQNGTLAATATYENNATSVTFTNTYNVGPAEAVVPVEKILSVQTGESAVSIKDKFTFTLAAAANCPADGYKLPEQVTKTNPDADGGTTSFDAIEFTKPNTYYFTITESRSSEVEDDGITVDTTPKIVTIVVVDNGEGKLVVDEQNSDYKNTQFTNYYNVTDTQATISVEKILEKNGYEPDSIAGKFTFTLAAAADCPADGYKLPEELTKTNPNADGGTTSFDPITFSKVGTYTFTVTESGTVGGITNDSEDVKTVTIKVKDNGNGKLVVTTTETDRTVSFTNSYDVGETSAKLYVKKEMSVLSGEGPADYTGKFTFTLAAAEDCPADGYDLPDQLTVTNPATGTVSFDDIEFTEPGKYTFTITETVTKDAKVDGITNDANNPKKVTIEVTDNGDGSLTATVVEGAETSPVTFTNTYKVDNAKVSFPVVKTVEAAGGLTAPDATNLFKFTLSAADGTPKPATVSYTNPDAKGGKVTFGEIEYSKTGTYTYTITESVADDKNAGGFTLAAAQTVTVEVKDNGYGKLVATASSTEANPLTFTNKYDVTSAVADIPVTKTLSVPEGLVGPDDITGKFTFTLEALDGAPMPDGAADGKKSVTNPADDGGTKYFGEITFDEPGEYKYQITESLSEGQNADGISVDPVAKTVIITIKDNRQGQLVVDTEKSNYQSTEFINSYDVAETKANIPAVKTLKVISGENPASIAHKFTFTLAALSNPDDGAVLPAVREVTNPNADGGPITFGDITFKKPGTYTFTITESVTLTEEEKLAMVTNKVVPGVSIDGEPKQVTIEVVDNKDGTMTATVQTYTTQNPVTFTNNYSVGNAMIDIPVYKILAEKDLHPASIAGKFTFTLAAVTPADAPMPKVSSIIYQGENDGSVTFEDIEFTKAGLYIYEVTESGSADGVTNDPVAKKRVAVKVVDNGDGTLSAARTDEGLTATDAYGVVLADKDVTFTNTYTVEPISKKIPAEKILELPEGVANIVGPDDITGKFTFTLAADAKNPVGATLPTDLTTTNEGAKGGKITFGDITFTKPGKFVFTVTESVTVTEEENGEPTEGEAKVPGITNDSKATKTVEIIVTDMGNGTLTAEVTPETGDTLTFTNSYKVEPTSISFPVKKTLSVAEELNAPDITGKYTFDLSATVGTPMPEVVSYTNPDADGGVVTFGPIEYTAPGTYTYTVKETGDVAGITNDGTAEKTVTVTVVDNKDGTMTATATATEDKPLEFINTYTVKETTASIPVLKTVEVPEGLKLGDVTKKFTFTLAAVSPADAPMPETKVHKNPAANGGSMTFGLITFDAPGTYKYTIEETGSFGGVTNDPVPVKDVTIKVVDNRNGTLTATVEGIDEENPLTFTNSYEVEPTTASFPVEKILEVPEGLNANSIAGKFTFKLAAHADTPNAPLPATKQYPNPDAKGGTVTFGEITYTAPGTYKYTVTEEGKVDGITNDRTATKTVTVTVKDNGDGTLTATPSSTNDDPLTFTNKYKTDNCVVSFPVVKELSAEGLKPADITERFIFKLAAHEETPNAPMPKGKDGIVDELKNPDKDGGEMIFGEITYTKPGTYKYTVTESVNLTEEEKAKGLDKVPGITNDTELVKEITVTVSDNGSGKLVAEVSSTDDNPLTFINTYTVQPTTASFPVVKELSAEGLEPDSIEGKFTFKLTAQNNAPMPKDEDGKEVSELTNPDADGGIVTFETITFTKPGTYVYTIEEIGEVKGITNDSDATKNVTIEVVDNGDGTLTATADSTAKNPLTFTNTYTVEPIKTSFPVKKTLSVATGLTAPDIKEAFTFTLTDANGNVIDTVKNPDSNGGVVSFKEIEYKAPGLYTYTITETGTVNGITNEQGSKTVTVNVVDNGDGTMTATASSTASAPVTFTNTYSVNPIEHSFDVEKILTVPEGLKCKDITGKFTFTVTAEDGTPMPTKTSATNPDADGGIVTFGPIEFTKPGEFVYTITESGSADGVTNDATAAKTVTIDVVDNRDGTLSATCDVDGKALTFTNVYSVEPTEAKVYVEKILTVPEGLTCNDITGKFTFTLKAVDGAPMPAAAVNDEVTLPNPDPDGGVVVFEKIPFTAPGTYQYTIEEKGEVDGITNDAINIKSVSIEVKDNGDGTLSATASVTEENPLTFTNVYSVEPTTASFPVKKALKATGLTPNSIKGKFTFTLTAEDGTPMPETTSYTNPDDNGGVVTFGAMEYTMPGDYTYTIEETGSADGVTNDVEKTKTVVVKVVDNGDGTLTATADSTTDKPLTFTNTYTVKPTVAKIPVLKILDKATGLTPNSIEGKFTFTLTAEEGVPMPETTSYTNPSADGGTVTFGDITFTAPGKFEYTIEETGSADGVTNDDVAKKTVLIEVVDNGDGTLTAKVPVSDKEPLTFKNTYTVQPTTASFPVEKLLEVDEDDTAPDITGAFSFEVAAKDNAPLPDTIRYSNPKAEGGVVTFGEITYTMPGTYKYTVTETGSVSGVINDATATKDVTVEVVDNGDGTLTATPSSTTDAPLTFTNSYEVVDINVQKVWNDESNRDGKRPESIQVQLMADGQPVGDAVKLDDSNSWKHVWSEVPRYSTSSVDSPITYTVKEIVDETTLTAYDVAVNYVWDGDSNGDVTITNTHEIETIDIKGSKTWVDLDDKYLKRPDSVTIRLLADGVEIDSRKVTEADKWSWTFTKLPKYKAGEVGKEITYTVAEDVVTGYITTINDFNVTNTMNLVEFIKLDQQTGKRLPGASFALYEGTAATYDASKPVETWVSTADTKILAGLKVGQTYTIVETKAPSGYAMMAPFQFTVELTDIPGTYRSFSLSNCHVYRFRKLDSTNGGLVHGAQMAVLDANNNIIASWYSSGDNDGWYEIADSKLKAGVDYKLVELESPWGYEIADPITFSIDENDGKLVINGSKSNTLDLVMYDEPWPEVTPTPEPTETSFTVTKRWEDKDNVLGLRPSSITVHLYRKLRTEAEYPTDSFMTVNMMSNGKDVWKFTFNDLPRRSPDGILYDYTVREEEVEGYVVSYLNNGKTIVNTIPEEDYPPTPTPTLPYVTPTPTIMPRIPAGVQFVDGEWMYIDEYGIPLGGIPLTGDNTNFVLWGMAIGLPLLVAALAAVEIRRRKKLLVAAEQDEEVDEEA